MYQHLKLILSSENVIFNVGIVNQGTDYTTQTCNICPLNKTKTNYDNDKDKMHYLSSAVVMAMYGYASREPN